MAFWLTAMVGGVLGAAELSVVVAPGAPCVERPSLVRALEAAGLRVVDVAEAGLQVSLAGVGERLRVTAVRRPRALERVVPASARECPAVERVVVALVASWARESLRGAKPEAPRASRAPASELTTSGSSAASAVARVSPSTAGTAGAGGRPEPTPSRPPVVSADEAPAASPRLPPQEAAREGAGSASLPSASRGEPPRPGERGSPAVSTLSTDGGATWAGAAPPLASGGTATTASPSTPSGGGRPTRLDEEATAPTPSGPPASNSPLRRDGSAAAPAGSVNTTPTDGSATLASGDRSTTRPDGRVPATTRSAPSTDDGEASAGGSTRTAVDREPVGSVGTAGPGAAPASPGLGEASVASAASPLAVELAVLGGVGVGPTSAAAPLGGLHAGLWLGRWGLLLEGGLEGAREATLAPARVWAARQWLSLSARVAFVPTRRLTLDLAAGVRGWRLAAGSEGVEAAREATLFTGGGVASAGASWQLVGPLALHARLTGALRGQAEHFTVDGLGPVLTLQPFEAGLALGLVARFGG